MNQVRPIQFLIQTLFMCFAHPTHPNVEMHARVTQG